jgi:flagella basal body P-ring formation protein FlgA
MIPSLRNILLPTILVVAVLIPDVLSADVIRLRHSVRRSAADQPIRLGDIAILEGPQAEALSRTVIRPANARDATDVIRIRVAEVRESLHDAEVYWGTLDLEGGMTLVRPPAPSRRASGPESKVLPVAVVASAGLDMACADGAAEGVPFVAASDLLEAGGSVTRQIAKSMIAAWGPEAFDLQLAIDTTSAEAIIAGASAFSVELLGNPRGDRCNARITQQREDGRISRATLVRVDVRIVRQVPIASRDLRTGRKLSGSDFEMANCAVRPSEVVLDIVALEDRQLEGSLAAGAPMTAGLLKAEFVVERHGEVLILASGTGIRVEVPGVAMEKGRIGDTIECRLRTVGERDRNARFSAVVIGPGRVWLPDR